MRDWIDKKLNFYEYDQPVIITSELRHPATKLISDRNCQISREVIHVRKRQSVEVLSPWSC